jgi:hypothetical protein
MSNRRCIGDPAAWDALDSLLPPLPAEPPAVSISGSEAVRRRFVDELPPGERDLLLDLGPFDLLGLDGIGIVRSGQ